MLCTSVTLRGDRVHYDIPYRRSTSPSSPKKRLSLPLPPPSKFLNPPPLTQYYRMNRIVFIVLIDRVGAHYKVTIAATSTLPPTQPTSPPHTYHPPPDPTKQEVDCWVQHL